MGCVYSGHLLPADQIEARGFRVMLHLASMTADFRGVRDALEELRASGAIETDACLCEDMLQALAVPETLARARKFEP